MKTPVIAALLVPLLATLVLASTAAAAEGCKREPAAQWPVRIVRGMPVVDGAINGTKVNILVDTGANASLIGNAVAERLKLNIDYRTTERVKGGYQVGVATLDEFRIGDSAIKQFSMRVAGNLGAGVDVLLGTDFIRRYDFEFDLPGGFVRAFHPAHCPGESLAYWDAKAFEVGLEKSTPILLPVSVNGKRGTALLFSGTGVTAVSQAFAERTGVKPGGPGVFPAGCTTAGKPMWTAKFEAFAIGGRAVPDARIDVRPLGEEFDVYLGSDFLKAHRVLVSLGRGTMYFTAAGGLPFTAVPTLPCDPNLQGKSQKERLALLDAALTRNSRDAAALLWRAALVRREQPKQAIADLDAVIALEPGNPVAFSLRGEARAILDDHQGAIADFGSAASHGMVSVTLHAHRGDLRGKVGDYPGAIEDYERALRIDPRHVGSLRSRGRQLYHAGKYEEAERDFTKLVAVSPGEVNSIWLSLALASRGLDSRAALEAGRAHMKDEEWPAPILDYLLGRIDREALMAGSAVADHKVRKERECEARYYVAARLLVDGKAGEARPLLEQVEAECPRHFIEYDSAVIELKRKS